MPKIRTVIFGGSFDPVHNGHTLLASEVVTRGIAHEVWFMLSPQNPLKQGHRMTDENVRMQMLQMALEDYPCFVACDFEFSLPRPSYTLNTLQSLEKAYPEREFILLIGADNWEQFDSWHRGDEILARYEVLVYPRGTTRKPLLPKGVKWLDAKLFDVSSTMLRHMAADGGDIAQYVHPKVADFINVNKIYRKI